MRVAKTVYSESLFLGVCMDINQIVKEIIDKNDWLNGWADYEEGDIMEIVNQPEKFEQVTEKTSLWELYNDLKNYDGTFKFKNLLFFSDSQYGTFVYDINNPDRSNYIEHLTMPAISFEDFMRIVAKLTKEA
jgi:hypothetical protein